MKFTLDNTKVPDGTILVFGIRYHGQSEGGTHPRTYTYAMLRAGGYWYVTGSGKSPVAAGWGAVERWLERDGREVVWVEATTGRTRLWPPPQEHRFEDGLLSPMVCGVEVKELDGSRGQCGKFAGDLVHEVPTVENCPHHPDNPGSDECQFDSCRNCGGYHCGWICSED